MAETPFHPGYQEPLEPDIGPRQAAINQAYLEGGNEGAAEVAQAFADQDAQDRVREQHGMADPDALAAAYSREGFEGWDAERRRQQERRQETVKETSPPNPAHER